MDNLGAHVAFRILLRVPVLSPARDELVKHHVPQNEEIEKADRERQAHV